MPCAFDGERSAPLWASLCSSCCALLDCCHWYTVMGLFHGPAIASSNSSEAGFTLTRPATMLFRRVFSGGVVRALRNYTMITLITASDHSFLRSTYTTKNEDNSLTHLTNR